MTISDEVEEQAVLSKAEPNQILITKSVKNLLSGTGLEFTDLGNFSLKGIDENYRLFAFQKSI